MKKMHFLFWMGLGGILSYTLGEFANRIFLNDSMANFFIWSAILACGAAISSRQNKKTQE